MSKIPALDERIKGIIASRKLDKELYREVLDEFTYEGIPEDIAMRDNFPIIIEDEHFNKIVALRHAFIGNELISMGVVEKVRDFEDITYGLSLMDEGMKTTFLHRLTDFMLMERSEFTAIFYEDAYKDQQGPVVQVYAEDSVADALGNLGFRMKG